MAYLMFLKMHHLLINYLKMMAKLNGEKQR
jgi:hypothetical protein